MSPSRIDAIAHARRVRVGTWFRLVRGRVVPIISASVSCKIFGGTRVGLSCLPSKIVFRKPATADESGPMIITELSNRAKAALPPGAERVHIYDTPLHVLAALLAIGFVLTLLVKPLRRSAYKAPASARGGVKAG